ncbi:formyl transferase [Candidatus Pacearchaeota archaeon]|nr:formyl transferase [Candidatus Pacearchaeota archaeon]|tara:strand:+ start:1206 stop:2018 length:813 start_codon:yes stop_codon:yes gene_type:complete
MALTKLYDPENGKMRVAGLMSGSGSNLREIIEYGEEMKFIEDRSPYQVVVIFSDSSVSNAVEIGRDYGIPVITNDIRGFYKVQGKPRNDMQVRREFDQETVKALEPFDINVAAYAGYMSIATEPLINAFLGVNVHPADLSIMDEGRRKYTGDNAVRDAILAGEKQIRSTTHIVEPAVDYGRILMISGPTGVNLPKFLLKNKSLLSHLNQEKYDKLFREEVDRHQNLLKKGGDWIIFPRTLGYIANGRYSQDENGDLYFDGKPIPDGTRIE